jgi:hypothetical protein
MITIDEKVQFDPFETITGFASEDNKGKLVTGTVVFVHYENKWFSVEYDCGGKKQRISFKFCDIGKTVVICKE